MANAYDILKESGPSTVEEMDCGKVGRLSRELGVSRFKPSSRAYGSTLRSGINMPIVYYIDGEHDPRDVIEKWLSINEKLVEDVGNWAIHHRISTYGDEWKVASRDILGPFENDGFGGDTTSPRTCPFCEDEVMRYPDHLPCDESP